MDANDYIVTIIVWLPSVLIFHFVAIFISIPNEVLYSKVLVHEILVSKRTFKLLLVSISLSIIIAIGYIIFISISRQWYLCVVPALIIFITGTNLIQYLLNRKSLNKNYSKILPMVFSFVILFSVTAGMGLMEGYAVLEYSLPQSVFELKEKQKPVAVTILRATTKGYLVKNEKLKRIEFYPNDNVINIVGIEILESKKYCDQFPKAVPCLKN